MNIKIEYRQIKSMSIRILDRETILVRANPRYQKDEILAFVDRKRDWIAKHQMRAQEIEESIVDEPNTIWVLGKIREIVVQQDKKDSVELQDNQILICCAKHEDAMALLNRYLSQFVRELLEKQTKQCILLFSSIPMPNIEIKQLKSKWGICYYKQGKIVLNAALLHPPLHCVDYVIVHELMHFYYPDHQAGFHQAMKKAMPKYKEYEKELRMYERFLKRKTTKQS